MEITKVNKLKKEFFLNKFGNIVECYPGIAEKLHEKLPFKNVKEIIELSQNILEELDVDEKEKVLKLHPDLAGKLADENKLTVESTEEQKAAGLHNLEKNIKRELNSLNTQYKEKFGFPFVICARENKVNAILEGLGVRLNNEREQELSTGIKEVKKICKLRILDIVKH